MKLHHWGMVLIGIGAAMNTIDELTAAPGTAEGILYGPGKPLSAVYTALPLDPGLILIVVGAVMNLGAIL